MTDPSLSDPAATPDRAVIASEEARPQAPTNVAGSAMLDAQVAAGGTQPQGEPVDAPIATNFSGATTVGDPQTAGVTTSHGVGTSEEPSLEQGRVNLQHDPDVPEPEMSGNLPDTDPVGLPIDPETNLPN